MRRRVALLVHGTPASASPLGLQRSVQFANTFSATGALVIASVVLIAAQFFALRAALLDDVSLQARVVAANSAGALTFADARAGADILAALQLSASVRNAEVLDTQGRVLASYPPDVPLQTPLRESFTKGHAFSLTHLEVSQPVEYRGERLGTVWIRATQRQLYLRLVGYALLTLVVGLASLAITLLLVARVRRAVVQAEEQLDYLAHVDPVSELPNRHAFNNALREALLLRGAGARESDGAGVGLVLFDLDNFKVVNDTLGHSEGDALLKALGKRLPPALRTSDTLYRVGGDEFAVILPDVKSVDDLSHTTARLLERLAEPIAVNAHELYVTASFGAAFSPDHGTDLETLTRNADTAMYEAKRGGKNSVALFKAEMDLQLQNRLLLVSDLHRALEREEFLLHYQPQMSVTEGRIVGVEALMRWQHPIRGLVPPNEFIPVAEECGLIVPLGRWALRAACRQAAAWNAQGIGPLQVSVNISVRQLRQEKIVEQIAAALEESGLPPQQLELEITESILMETVESSATVLRRIRDAGIRISIDDFGTGYSSLSYLPTFPIHQLKIDRSFMQRVPGDGEAITTAIVALARSFGLTVVAEGVETAEQLAFLRKVGCNTMQGYYFSPAVPAAKLGMMLLTQPELVTGGVAKPPEERV